MNADLYSAATIRDKKSVKGGSPVKAPGKGGAGRIKKIQKKKKEQNITKYQVKTFINVC